MIMLQEDTNLRILPGPAKKGFTHWYFANAKPAPKIQEMQAVCLIQSLNPSSWERIPAPKFLLENQRIVLTGFSNWTPCFQD